MCKIDFSTKYPRLNKYNFHESIFFLPLDIGNISFTIMVILAWKEMILGEFEKLAFEKVASDFS